MGFHGLWRRGGGCWGDLLRDRTAWNVPMGFAGDAGERSPRRVPALHRDATYAADHLVPEKSRLFYLLCAADGSYRRAHRRNYLCGPGHLLDRRRGSRVLGPDGRMGADSITRMGRLRKYRAIRTGSSDSGAD